MGSISSALTFDDYANISPAAGVTRAADKSAEDPGTSSGSLRRCASDLVTCDHGGKIISASDATVPFPVAYTQSERNLCSTSPPPGHPTPVPHDESPRTITATGVGCGTGAEFSAQAEAAGRKATAVGGGDGDGRGGGGVGAKESCRGGACYDVDRDEGAAEWWREALSPSPGRPVTRRSLGGGVGAEARCAQGGGGEGGVEGESPSGRDGGGSERGRAYAPICGFSAESKQKGLEGCLKRRCGGPAKLQLTNLYPSKILRSGKKYVLLHGIPHESEAGFPWRTRRSVFWRTTASDVS